MSLKSYYSFMAVCLSLIISILEFSMHVKVWHLNDVSYNQNIYYVKVYCNKWLSLRVADSRERYSANQTNVAQSLCLLFLSLLPYHHRGFFFPILWECFVYTQSASHKEDISTTRPTGFPKKRSHRSKRLFSLSKMQTTSYCFLEYNVWFTTI